MSAAPYVSSETLLAGLDLIRQSPKTSSLLDMIVRRPAVNLREALTEARLDEATGLEGDSWLQRGSSRTPDKRANPDAQITIMGSRAVALMAVTRERWELAGDQLFFDLDLSEDNLPAGSRLKIGEAIIEITEEPHTGCSKFKTRYGADALEFVNSKVGRALRLRGANARIIASGQIRTGDAVVKL